MGGLGTREAAAGRVTWCNSAMAVTPAGQCRSAIVSVVLTCSRHPRGSHSASSAHPAPFPPRQHCSCPAAVFLRGPRHLPTPTTSSPTSAPPSLRPRRVHGKRDEVRPKRSCSGRRGETGSRQEQAKPSPPSTPARQAASKRTRLAMQRAATMQPHTKLPPPFLSPLFSTQIVLCSRAGPRTRTRHRHPHPHSHTHKLLGSRRENTK